MSSILVEDRLVPLCRQILQSIADTCEESGHQVIRWRGPMSGRVPHSRQLAPCQAAFVWNGAHPRLLPAVEQLRQQGTQVAFVELGWNPQSGTCQIDRRGINANASWAREPLATVGITPLPIRKSGDLLVALQLDDDTQVTNLSPWFKNMREFVEFLCLHSTLRVRVRPHPRAPVDRDLQRRTLELGGQWDDSPSFAVALQRCRAVAILNSSVGIEALGQRLPVLCFGLANYRHPGAVYCLDSSPAATQRVTRQLVDGETDLSEELVDAAYQRVMSHQWRCEEIEQRLPGLLAEMLADAPFEFSHQVLRPTTWLPIPHWLRWRTPA